VAQSDEAIVTRDHINRVTDDQIEHTVQIELRGDGTADVQQVFTLTQSVIWELKHRPFILAGIVPQRLRVRGRRIPARLYTANKQCSNTCNKLLRLTATLAAHLGVSWQLLFTARARQIHRHVL
jgi:hypothetical protein